MAKRLFLLDGMALVYRAHFAFIARPIMSSKGVNTSALFGFTNTLLDLLANHQPTHLAIVFDTAAPTQRHEEFPAYKVQREETPEDILDALPNIERIAAAMNIPVLKLDGYEADDIIGTLVRRAEGKGFESFMVTPDKDFGQLVSDKTRIFKPGRAGGAPEILGLKEIRERWGIERPEQVIDILGLMGDASDNIPGIPGIGEKTAAKLIAQFGGIDNLLARTDELKGKQREKVENNRDAALLSRRLATINCEVPIEVDLDGLKLRPPDEAALKELLVEFEFNSIGRRLFGNDFNAGHGFNTSAPEDIAESATLESAPASGRKSKPSAQVTQSPPVPTNGAVLKKLADVPHRYEIVSTAATRAKLVKSLKSANRFSFAVEADHSDPRQTNTLGIAFALKPHEAFFVPVGKGAEKAKAKCDELRGVFENEQFEKVGCDLKLDLSRLKVAGASVAGGLFDVMLAHALAEPDLRHTLAFQAEALLGYSPMSAAAGGGSEQQLDLTVDPLAQIADAAMERADLALQLRDKLLPMLKDKAQEKVFFEIESPLLPVLVDMECEGVRVDSGALREFTELLTSRMAEHEAAIHRLAGTEFNVNSPRQLGEILFDKLKLADKAKKTRTGQYATDEQTLLALSGDHEIVRRLLDYRMCAKLKSTYSEALPSAISPVTGRVHTTYNQLATATGRLNSVNPNLQNIPIRSELGQEIRKAFVPRDGEHLLLSADYSQIELRIIAALSKEEFLIEAFKSGADVHTATAARVFGVPPGDVIPEMRSRAKMVNYGIAYGMSAFGLSQRLRIPRKEAAEIIEQYFAQFPGIARFMEDSVNFAKEHGYVETVIGRRRYLRDINSANATIRGASERNAINAPIQGTAADMIKIAMINIHRELASRKLRTRMLLQVHDELVFDLFKPEEQEVRKLVAEHMRNALDLGVPIEVEMGVGENWIEAH